MDRKRSPLIARVRRLIRRHLSGALREDIFLRSLLMLALAGIALPGQAAEITNLRVELVSPNSGDSTEKRPRRERVSEVAILDSSASSFQTRYAQIVAIDVAALGNTERFDATSAYEIRFDVSAGPAEAWEAKVETRRRGALTLRHDGGRSASAEVGRVTGSVSGASLTGSLDLAAVGPKSGDDGGTEEIDQSAVATVAGVAGGSITLRFAWDSYAESKARGAKGGDEAAVRLGLSSTLQRIEAGDYPGAGRRDRRSDGHFVRVLLTSTVTVEKPRIESANVRLNPGNTADFQKEKPRREINSEVVILSSSKNDLETRYAQIVAVDVGPLGEESLKATSDYSILLKIDATTPWALTVNSRRKGHLTVVRAGFQLGSTAEVGKVDGILTGNGWATGELDFEEEFKNEEFEEVSSATVFGCQEADLELRFRWDSKVYSGGAEAAVRFGLSSDLERFTAGDYPGPGNRDRLQDGHFVTLSLAQAGSCQRRLRPVWEVGFDLHYFFPASFDLFREGEDPEPEHRGDPDLGIGLGVDYSLSPNTFLGLRTNRQAAELAGGVDVDFTHYHLSTRLVRTQERWRPFASISAGLSRAGVEGRRGGQEFFSASVSVGADLLFSKNFGLKSEGRLMWVDTPDALWQTSLAAGVFYRWGARAVIDPE